MPSKTTQFPNYGLMRKIEEDYQTETGLSHRKDYSIFYGPLLKSRFAIIDDNPGGSPDRNNKIVDVMAGQHELVEGRCSGPTTKNQAKLLKRLMKDDTGKKLREVQKINRCFRRGARVDRKLGMREAAPYIKRILEFIEPELLILGGAGGRGCVIDVFARVMGGEFQLDKDSVIMGPNGKHEALYFCTGDISIPSLRPRRVIGTYHPAKWHDTFFEKVYVAIENEFRKIVG